MAVLIMAAGTVDPKRWGGKQVRKPLLPVFGEPLIVFMQKKLISLGHLPIVVTPFPEIQEATINGNFFVPAEHEWYAHTLLSTKELWEDETVVFQGDAVFSNQNVRLICECEQTPSFFGEVTGHVHAFKFAKKDHDLFIDACENVMEIREAQGKPCKVAITEAVYRAICDGRKSMKGVACSNKYHRQIFHDWFTTDFDSKELYDRWIKEHPTPK